jgi:hypothetical protein
MTHLGDRITDFIFGELSATEMEELRRHVSECAECRSQVQQFEHTRAMLKTSPDVDPPRRIVFEVERPASVRRWQWLAPVGIAAAILLTVLIAAPIQVQWNESQLTIAFGRAPAAPTSQPLQEANYERIDRDMRQLQAQLEYLDAQQQELEKQNWKIASNMPRPVSRTGGE